MLVLLAGGRHGLAVDVDLDIGCAYATAIHGGGAQPRTYAKPIDIGLQIIQVETCIDQGAQDHITTDTGETIEVGDQNRGGSRQLGPILTWASTWRAGGTQPAAASSRVPHRS